MNNRGLLVVIALVLIGILGILVVDYRENQKTPAEKIGESVGEAVEDVGESIQDGVQGH